MLSLRLGKNEFIELNDCDRDQLPPIHGEARVRRDPSSTPCAGMVSNRRVQNERLSPLTLSPAPMRGFFFSGCSADWLKMKNPAAPAVKREAEEDWG
jgi:hypothetical protein